VSKYTVTHIIQGLSRGGGARATLYLAKYSAKFGQFKHRIVSLADVDPQAVQIAAECGVDVVPTPDSSGWNQIFESSDIVQFSWWNNPEMYQLFTAGINQPCRLVGWFHVGGHAAPQILTNTLVDFFDLSLACSPYTYSHSAFQSLPASERDSRCGMIYGATDFERINEVKPVAHDGFNVGYIGTIDFIKMHPSFVRMSVNANVSDARFVLAGAGGAGMHQIMEEAKILNSEHQFNYLGYIENLPALLSSLDVYGYPLREDTYAASEMNLQEVMYAGIPVVVLPSGGIRDLVIDGYTGIVAKTEEEYSQAIRYLYENPDERARLGNNAKKYASEIFGAHNAGKAINKLYEKLLLKPKRPHIWRQNSRPDPYTHLLPKDSLSKGSSLLIESLGSAGGIFINSLKSNSVEELINADIEISKVSEVMLKSGVSSYAEAFHADWILKYWQGIIFSAHGNYNSAIVSLVAAMERGGGDMRIPLALSIIVDHIQEASLKAQLEPIMIQLGLNNFDNDLKSKFKSALIKS
jgi:glycosyltransferase involved in cell wall biosynthesis